MPVAHAYVANGAPALLRTLAVLLLAAGVGVWSVVLLAPAARPLPPVLNAATSPLHETAAVARWFGGAALRVRIAPVGIIASGDGRGAALLSIDGAPARAYRAGHTLAPGVVLESVGPKSIAIAQDGTLEEIALPSTGPTLRGFIPAGESPAPR